MKNLISLFLFLLLCFVSVQAQQKGQTGDPELWREIIYKNKFVIVSKKCVDENFKSEFCKGEREWGWFLGLPVGERQRRIQ